MSQGKLLEKSQKNNPIRILEKWALFTVFNCYTYSTGNRNYGFPVWCNFNFSILHEANFFYGMIFYLCRSFSPMWYYAAHTPHTKYILHVSKSNGMNLVRLYSGTLCQLYKVISHGASLGSVGEGLIQLVSNLNINTPAY